MPETCTVTHYEATTSTPAYDQQQCFNPLQFQVFVILAVCVFASAIYFGWRIIKTK